ncbi:MAG: hypothetical protein E6931_11635 [Clostridium botulinum]|nr:hypothetical protein [Clostridium botulinum]
MERIKQLGLIISSISAVLTIIVLIIKFVLNMPYKSIEISLGIKKNDKTDSIVFFILIIITFIIFLLVAYLFYNKINSLGNIIKHLDKASILTLLHLLGTGVVWIILFLKNRYFNENILKFVANANLKMSKRYSLYSKIHLALIIIIDSFVVVWYFNMSGINNIDTGCLMTSIIISIILAIIIYSRFQLKSILMSLQKRTIHVKHSKVPIRGCKIIYINNKYTCVYSYSKIIYIDNNDILKIESFVL